MQIPKEAVVRHIRDYRGEIHATLVYFNGAFGLSVRNPCDAVNRKLGIVKAFGRSVSKGYRNKVSIVPEHFVVKRLSGNREKLDIYPINQLIKAEVQRILEA